MPIERLNWNLSCSKWPPLLHFQSSLLLFRVDNPWLYEDFVISLIAFKTWWCFYSISLGVQRIFSLYTELFIATDLWAGAKLWFFSTGHLMSISSPLHLSESIPKSSETRPNFDPIVKLRASRPSILRVDWNCRTCVKNDNVDMQKRSLHHELIQMVGTWKPWMRQEIKRGEY